MRFRVDVASLGLLAGCSLLGYDPVTYREAEPEPDASEVPASEAGVELDATQPELDARLEAAVPEDATVDAVSSDLADATMPELDAALAEAGVDAAIEPGVEAGIEAGVEAGVEAGIEAGIADAGPSCGGARALNLCWYLAPASTSCNSFCASRGGYDTRTASTVGGSSQGGTLSNCSTVFSALGIGGSVANGTRTDLGPLGCHQWVATSVLWWLGPVAFDPSNSSSRSRPVCACAN